MCAGMSDVSLRVVLCRFDLAFTRWVQRMFKRLSVLKTLCGSRGMHIKCL